MPGDQPEPVTPSVEPEVLDLVRLDPPQIARVLMNRVQGQTVARVVTYVAPSDGKQRWVMVFENGSGLIFQPQDAGRLFLTFVERIVEPPPQDGELPGGASPA